MSACDTCAFDGGDPGNIMAYVHCLHYDRIMARVDDCEHYQDQEDDEHGRDGDNQTEGAPPMP